MDNRNQTQLLLPTKKKKRRVLRPAVLLVTIATVVVLITILLISIFRQAADKPSALPEVPDDMPTIDYHGHEIPIVTDLPVNPYDSSLFITQDGFMSYRSDEVATFSGIDVSSHQDTIDWPAVKASGIDYAMIRAGYRGATEGKIYIDNKYIYNINRAVEAGLDVGIYFFSQAITVEEAQEEAITLLQWIKGYDITYPVAYDWEFMNHIEGNRTADMTKEQLTQCALAFCSVIEQAGYTPMIYFDLNTAYNYYDLSLIGHIDFWVAEWHHRSPSFYYDLQMFQYTSLGEVDGIVGEVDLNISFVDYAANKRK